jgi:predicted nuclease of predicted toxin-antitoxin system
LRFLIDSMLPPRVAELLRTSGHDATTPYLLGAHNLADEVLIELAAEEGRVIVTENASDFAAVTTCPVLFVRKSWWPTSSLSTRLAAALDRWATANPDPGSFPHWLTAELR